jgi:hypothetical protein
MGFLFEMTISQGCLSNESDGSCGGEIIFTRLSRSLSFLLESKQPSFSHVSTFLMISFSLRKR